MTPVAGSDVFAAVMETPAAQGLRERLERGGVLSSLVAPSSAWAFLAVFVRRLLGGRTVVVVADSLKTQERLHQDVETWLASDSPSSKSGSSPTGRSAERPLFYPAWETLPHEARLPHADIIAERLETLGCMLGCGSGAPSAVITTNVVALQQRTLPPDFLRSHTRVLARGAQLDPLDLVEWLEDEAYEPEAKVTQKGDLAMRGGIVDVFPLTSPWPVRFEFFGNEIESLRLFDPQTQVSTDEVDQVVLTPAGEIGILKRITSGTRKPQGDIDSPSIAAAPISFAALTDYLPPDAIVFLCAPSRLDEVSQDYERQVPTGDPFFISWQRCLEDIRQRGLTIVPVETEADPGCYCPETVSLAGGLVAMPVAEGPRLRDLEVFRVFGETAPAMPVIETRRRALFDQVHRWLRQGWSVHLFCNNDGERERFCEVWLEYGYSHDAIALLPPVLENLPASAASKPASTPLPGVLCARLGALSGGFECEDARLVVVTDAEVFGRYKVQRPRRLKSAHAMAALSATGINLTELAVGDYVVHLHHGIGRYLGLGRLPASPQRKGAAVASGPSQECLIIEYAPARSGLPPPKLYVPIAEAHLVGKYIGSSKARPPLNTLAGTRWARTKARAEEAIRDFAADLLDVQAARASQPGFAFPADTPWQREFEGAFVYEETPDQVSAISQTKTDLESPKPMDRLVCGDAGFGKTEVAIRAAFKAVMAGKQVAMLTPTTVLAQQHFNTFRERMADYPVRIELLSRFRTAREQEGVTRNLLAGGVDIVIGTHRLVQDDVQFKDLGLVVIDEEQRFGVVHKEKLKRLRQLVDVLTLTATPIPRTLYLALAGARDMSTIQTPPQDRLPVETIIAAYDERLIRDAIQRELNRGGQVYYLHNRVCDIDSVALRIRALVPSARIEVGHGQMPSSRLEKVMNRFVNGRTDVLLSTSIVESGIDIPNANTIIIDRADRFGLSDLYQLRGRVGRYKHQAYAYLLLPRHATLLADARKRIGAIKQYSQPGSGFKIAMRDLEIRGAGNLLGQEQSGHIAAVGFDLYCQLLKQSVAALKGDPARPFVNVSTRFDFLNLGATGEPAAARPGTGASPPLPAACLPSSYVSEPQQRVELYRKLAQASDKAGIERFRTELQDRFGRLPPAAELLLLVADLKRLAAERGVTAIETRDNKVLLTRQGDFIMPGGKFPRLNSRSPKSRLGEIRTLLLAL